MGGGLRRGSTTFLAARERDAGGSTPDACFKLKTHVSMCVAVAFWRKRDTLPHGQTHLNSLPLADREATARGHPRLDTYKRPDVRLGSSPQRRAEPNIAQTAQ